MIRHWDERKKFKKTRDEMVGNLKLKRIIIRSTHIFFSTSIAIMLSEQNIELGQ